MSKKKNLIVFDIDDTLTKSEFQHQLAYVNTMKHFGITEINTHWKTYKHHTDSYILSENYEVNLKRDFTFSFIPDFETKMTEELLKLKQTEEIVGARAIVDFFMNETNYAITFATGSLLQPALVKLKQAGIAHNKDLVVSSNTIFEREGIVTEAITRAKQIYNVETFDSIISIGDGLWDLATARNLEVHFIGIGSKNSEDFKSNNCKVIIDDWTDFDLKAAELELGIVN
jgi:phosphoglycolate phosphatase-like HAD superfamily hydrolase